MESLQSILEAHLRHLAEGLGEDAVFADLIEDLERFEDDLDMQCQG